MIRMLCIKLLVVDNLYLNDRLIRSLQTSAGDERKYYKLLKTTTVQKQPFVLSVKL